MKSEHVRFVAPILGAVVGMTLLGLAASTASIQLLVGGSLLLLLGIWGVVLVYLSGRAKIVAVVALGMLMLLLDQYSYGGPAVHGASVARSWQVLATILLFAALFWAIILTMRGDLRASSRWLAGELVAFLMLNAIYMLRDGAGDRIFVIDSASPLPGYALVIGGVCRVTAIFWTVRRITAGSPLDARLDDAGAEFHAS